MGNLADKIDQLQRTIQDAIPEATLIALNVMLGVYTKRIFEFGMDSNQMKIGTYSTEPMLTGAKNFRTAGDANRFFKDVKSRKRKSRKDESIINTDWVTVKTPKGLKRLAVVPGGYREFRTLNKLQNAFVDLNFKGDLFFSIVIGNKNGVPVLGFNSFEQFEKAMNLELKYNKSIFKPSKEEIQKAREAFNDFIRERVQQLFSTW